MLCAEGQGYVLLSTWDPAEKVGTAISKDKSHGEQDTKRLCEVPSLKIWSKIRQFGELGSVSAQPFPLHSSSPPPTGVAGQPLGRRRQPLPMKKG